MQSILEAIFEALFRQLFIGFAEWGARRLFIADRAVAIEGGKMLVYSRGLRWASVIVVVGAAGLLVLALDAGGGVPVVMAGLLLACGALMVAEHFTRRVVFDGDGFVVHSWRGRRPRVAWADVVRWEPDSWFGYHYVTTTRGVIRLSIWLSGVPDFSSYLQDVRWRRKWRRRRHGGRRTR